MSDETGNFGSSGQQQQALQVIGHAMSFGAGVGLGYFLGARGGAGTD